MDMINVITIYDNDEREKELDSFFRKDKKYKLLASVRFDTQALGQIEYKNPDVLLLYLAKISAEAVALVERVYLTKQGCVILVIADEFGTEEMGQALEAGANKVLQAPFDPKQLSNAITLYFNREKSRQSSNQLTDKTSFSSQVISVFGTKGGVGKTTLAVNMAISLAKSRKKVALLDFDLQFGDIGIFLDIDKTDTIFELIQDNNQLDIGTVKSYMAIHSSGISVLLAPRSPEYSELIKSTHIEKIINIVKGYYDYVILDMPPAFNDVSLVALENSSVVLFVTNLDISSLKNTRISYDIISSLGFLDKIMTVINKDGISSIKSTDARKILAKKICAVIANDNKVAVNALNRGVPIILDSPKSSISNAINDLAYKIIAEYK